MSLHAKTRRLLWIGAAALSLAALGSAWTFGRSPPEVDVGRVTRGTFERFVEEDGRARVRDRFVVAAPVAAVVERPRYRVGDAVAKDELLATLSPLSGPLLDARTRLELEQRRGAAEAALDRARVTLSRATAAREHADAELARARSLAAGGSLPARDLEHAELDARLAARERDEAEFAVHLAEHERELARAALAAASRPASTPPEKLAIKAPVAGRVLRVYQESEGPVPMGAPLLEVGDPSALEIVVDVLSTDAVLVAPGSEARVTHWGGRVELEGRVRLVEPIATVKTSALGVEEQRVNVVIDVAGDAEGWNRVGDGYRVDARLLVERIEGALRVPTSALFREHGEWTAFVVDGGRARERTVRLRSYGPTQSAVESGLDEGAAVIEQPAESLRDGARVAVRASSNGDATR